MSFLNGIWFYCFLNLRYSALFISSVLWCFTHCIGLISLRICACCLNSLMTVFSLSVWTRSVVTFVCPPLTTILSPTSFPRFSSETHPSFLLNFVSLSFHSSLHSPSLSLILFYLVRLFLLSTLSPHLLFSPSILCFLCFLHRSTPSVLYLFILFSPSLSLFSIVSVTLLRLLHLFFFA